MAISFVTSAKQETPAASCVITISPTADDYLIGAYCNDIGSAVTWTFGTPLTQTFSGTSTSDAMDAGIGAGKAGSGITSVTTSVSADSAVGLIASFSGVDTTTANDASPVTLADSLGSTAGRTLSITTATNGAMLVYAAALDVGGTSDPTVTMSDDAGGLTWNTVYAYEAGGFRKLAISYALKPTSGAVNVTMTPSIATGFVGVLYALKPANAGIVIAPPSGSLVLSGNSILPSSYNQVGFRFRNDDGSETGATWNASQNTNINLQQNATIRLRMQLQAVVNPPPGQFQLEYRRVGDATFHKLKKPGDL